MSLALLLAAVLVPAIGAAYWLESRRLPKKRARFNNRDSVPLMDLFSRYYEGQSLQQQAFVDAWTTAARILKLDATKLLPTDRFDHELAPVKGHLVEDELVTLNDYYVSECRRLGISDPPRLQTLDDFVRTLTLK